MVIATYKSGLLHTKAYRIIHTHTSAVLDEHNLSMPEWTLLGLLLEYKNGIRLSDIASNLDVEPPFATNLVDQLEKKGLVARLEDSKDHRAKRIVLTPKGKLLVPKVESLVKERMKKLFKGAWYPEIMTYINVLKAIIANDERLTKGNISL